MQALPSDLTGGDSAHPSRPEDLAARIVVLGEIRDLVASLAGAPAERDLPLGRPTASTLAAGFGTLPPRAIADIARRCDTLSLVLANGLAALQRCQRSGRYNPRAAAALLREIGRDFEAIGNKAGLALD